MTPSRSSIFRDGAVKLFANVVCCRSDAVDFTKGALVLCYMFAGYACDNRDEYQRKEDLSTSPVQLNNRE